MISSANSATATQNLGVLPQNLTSDKEVQKNPMPANDSGQTTVEISAKGISLSRNGSQDSAFHGMATPPKPKVESQLAATYTNIEI